MVTPTNVAVLEFSNKIPKFHPNSELEIQDDHEDLLGNSTMLDSNSKIGDELGNANGSIF